VDRPGRLRWRAGLALVLLLAILSIPPRVEGPPATWASELVDGSTDVGEYNDLVLNSTGVPHIAYRRSDPFPGAVMHAWKVGAAWSNETVFSDAGIVGRYISLAVDSADRLHVSFFANDVLYYATNASGPWVSVIVDDDPTAIVGWYSSIAVDSADRPRIAYYDTDLNALRYARWTGTAWVLTTVVVPSNGSVSSRKLTLRLDQSDRPHIGYCANGDVWYAAWTGLTWKKQLVDPESDCELGMVLDAAGNPHFSYWVWWSDDLTYAHWTGTEWAYEDIEGETIGSWWESTIALTPGGEVVVAYMDGDLWQMRFARRE